MKFRIVESHILSVIVAVIGSYCITIYIYGVEEAIQFIGAASVAFMIWSIVEWGRRFFIALRFNNEEQE